MIAANKCCSSIFFNNQLTQSNFIRRFSISRYFINGDAGISDPIHSCPMREDDRKILKRKKFPLLTRWSVTCYCFTRQIRNRDTVYINLPPNSTNYARQVEIAGLNKCGGQSRRMNGAASSETRRKDGFSGKTKFSNISRDDQRIVNLRSLRRSFRTFSLARYTGVYSPERERESFPSRRNWHAWLAEIGLQTRLCSRSGLKQGGGSRNKRPSRIE